VEARAAVLGARRVPLGPLPAHSGTLVFGRVTSTEEEGSGMADRTLQTAVGIGAGALVGGFLGYFVSQVSTSDWENRPAAERSHMRAQYALSGAALGALTGYLVRPRTLHVRRQAPLGPVPPRTGRQLLAGADLRRSIGTNALEAVELERPEWLRSLPNKRALANVDTVNVAQSSIVVYVGEEIVGGVGLLHDVAIPEVTELRFYDAHEAERRWGGAHRFGAIEVVPVAATSPSSAQPSTVPWGSSTSAPPRR
jgi:hypothetical protein